MRIKTNYNRLRFEKRKGLLGIWIVMLKKGRGEIEFGEVRYDRNRKGYFLDITNFIDGITLEMSQELTHFLAHIRPRALPRKNEKKVKVSRASRTKSRAKAQARKAA